MVNVIEKFQKANASIVAEIWLGNTSLSHTKLNLLLVHVTYMHTMLSYSWKSKLPKFKLSKGLSHILASLPSSAVAGGVTDSAGSGFSVPAVVSAAATISL